MHATVGGFDSRKMTEKHMLSNLRLVNSAIVPIVEKDVIK